MMLPLFTAATLVGLAGLCSVCLRDVPRITGTAAIVCTLAALYAARVH
jgi:hypothetical protein